VAITEDSSKGVIQATINNRPTEVVISELLMYVLVHSGYQWHANGSIISYISLQRSFFHVIQPWPSTEVDPPAPSDLADSSSQLIFFMSIVPYSFHFLHDPLSPVSSSSLLLSVQTSCLHWLNVSYSLGPGSWYQLQCGSHHDLLLVFPRFVSFNKFVFLCTIAIGPLPQNITTDIQICLPRPGSETCFKEKGEPGLSNHSSSLAPAMR
jgi:hypothetical protein